MKFATVGTSWITEKFIEAALRTGMWELSGVYSRSLEKGKILADKFHCKPVYTDLESLAASDAEAVYIASPNSLHAGQAEFFLRHQKHVICEKPIALRIEQLELLCELAEENGVFLFEAYRHIHSPMLALIRENIQKIGPIRNAALSYNQYSSRYEAFLNGKNPNVFNPHFGGGALMDLGVYPLSLAVAIWGAPEGFVHLSADLSNGVDGTGSFVLRYPGFLCNITYSKLAEGRLPNEVIGENGGLVLDKVSEPREAWLTIKNQSPDHINPQLEKNDMFYEAMAFYRMIAENDREKSREYMRISLDTLRVISEAFERKLGTS